MPKRAVKTLITPPGSPDLAFLARGGAMGRLIQEHDWADTPLGPIEGWPQSLLTALSICLGSAFPVAIYWGPELRLLYNDAWSAFPGPRHPWALGRKGEEVWPDIWHIVGPQFEEVMRTGDGYASQRQLLPMQRFGEVEESYWDYSFSPIRGEDGSIVGVFNSGAEVTSVIQAEKALRVESELMRNVLDGMHEGYVLLGHDLRVKQINAEGLRMEGRPASEILGKLHSEAWPNTVGSETERLYMHALATMEPVSLEHCYAWEGGRDAWLEMRAYPSKEGLAVFYRDITERKQAELELRARDEMARLYAERVELALDAGAIIGTWVWDLTRDYFTADERFARSFGLDPEACRRGLKMDQVVTTVHPDDKPGLMEAIAEAVARGGAYSHEYRVKRADGQYHWVEANGRVELAEDGTPLRFPGVLLDIDEHQKFQEELKRTQAEKERQRRVYEAILNNTPDLAYVWNLEHRFIYANDILLKMWGRTWDEAIGKNCLELGYEPWHAEMHDREIDQVVATKRPVRGEVPFKGTFGRRIYDYILVPVIGEDGKVEAVAGTTRDVTEYKETQEAIQQSKLAAEEANQAKSDFLANMSHEIRTPLNAVVGIASLLERGSVPKEQHGSFFRTLRGSADALLELINDLLDISRIEQRDFRLAEERFPLDELFAEVISMLALRAREKNIGLFIDYEGVKGLRYNGDKSRLRQVIVNVIGNAIKFTEKGSVSVRVVRRPELFDGGGVEIQVIDTGIGIPKASQEKIFEKFSRASNAGSVPGSGLGLSITRHLLEMMGGTISLESEEGFGTKVFIQLPDRIARAVSYREAEAGRSQEAAAFTPTKRVLLVEDFAANILVASAILDDIGVKYDVAHNGQDALKMLANHDYGLVLMDVSMPVMDGLKATLKIRERELKNDLPRIPVVGMTAHALAGDRDNCLKAGMDDFLAKPVTAEAVFEKVRKYI